MALANLPSHIKPFVFSWPTGTYSSYITAIRTGAQSHQTQRDFVGALLPSPAGLLPAFKACRPEEMQLLVARICWALSRLPAHLPGRAGMIRALAAMGFRSFHIMAHSVGVRIVMASLPLLEQVFQPNEAVPSMPALLLDQCAVLCMQALCHSISLLDLLAAWSFC